MSNTDVLQQNEVSSSDATNLLQAAEVSSHLEEETIPTSEQEPAISSRITTTASQQQPALDSPATPNDAAPNQQQPQSSRASRRRNRSVEEIEEWERLKQAQFSMLWQRMLFGFTPFQIFVCIVQTVLLAARMALPFTNGVSNSFNLILCPLWILNFLILFSLLSWIIKDSYKAYRRWQRRRRRNADENERTSSRTLTIRHLNRYYAISSLIGMLLFTVTAVLIGLKIDQAINLPFSLICAPMMVFIFLYSVTTCILCTFVWRRVTNQRVTLAVTYVFGTCSILLFGFLLCLNLDAKLNINGMLIMVPILIQSMSYMVQAMLFIWWSLQSSWQANTGKYLYDFVPLPWFLTLPFYFSIMNKDMCYSQRHYEYNRLRLLRRRRLDSLVVFVIQMPLIIFWVLAGRLSQEVSYPPHLIIIVAAPILVTQALISCWVVLRERTMTMLFPPENDALVAEDAPEQQAAVEMQDIPVTNTTTAADNSILSSSQQRRRQNAQHLNYMILALHHMLRNRQAQDAQFGAPTTGDAALVEWLTEMQRFEQGNGPLPVLRANHGVSSEVMAMLPTWKYKKSTTATNAQDNCSICLAEYEDNEEVKTLPCFHRFHAGCIDDWLQQSNQCPICKFRVDVQQYPSE